MMSREIYFYNLILNLKWLKFVIAVISEFDLEDDGRTQFKNYSVH